MASSPSTRSLPACARGLCHQHVLRREEVQQRLVAEEHEDPPWGYAGGGDEAPQLPGGVRAAFDARVARGELRGGDAGQAAAVEALQQLEQRLASDDAGSGAEQCRGVYLHGGPGRGKTLLMDLFFQQCAPPTAPKP
jgi:hypothetical protein